MNNRPYRLCIDPGHGGQDPGAVSRSLVIKEKDINLSTGLLMKEYCIKGDYLFYPYMTRDDDHFVSLRERCHEANTQKVNAFVSIHTNAREMRGRPGLEIEVFHYPRSMKGREFANTALGLLINDRGIKKRINVISRGVKEGSYYVLKHTKMTSILVELGFITDNEEALFLREKENQTIMARALLEAAELFFEGGENEWILSQN